MATSARVSSREMRDILSYDLFPKINEDFAQRTAAGGVISVVSLVFMLTLFVQTTIDYATVKTAYDLKVDEQSNGAMRINLDVTLSAMHCKQVSLDIMDVSGDARLDVEASVRKQRVGSNGQIIVDSAEDARGSGVVKREPLPEGYCGDCYGAGLEGECCNDCQTLRRVYHRRGWQLPDLRNVEQCQRDANDAEMMNFAREGCHIKGYLNVNKVAGNFHIAPGKSVESRGNHIHDLSAFDGLESFNFSHTIHSISFGDEFPGVVNPLDGVSRVMNASAGVYQYRMNVVPARYQYLGFNARVVESNEYTVSDHFREFDWRKQPALPGIFFFYDLSPLRVEYREERMGFFKYIATLCAVVGGVFAVSNIVDGAVYQGQRAFKEKVDLGKQG